MKTTYQHLQIAAICVLAVIQFSDNVWADSDPAAQYAHPVSGSALVEIPNLVGLSDNQADKLAIESEDQFQAVQNHIWKQLQQKNLSARAKSDLYDLAADFRVYQAVDMMINDIGFIAPLSMEPDLAPSPSIHGAQGQLEAQMDLQRYGLLAFDEIVRTMCDRKPDVPFVASNTNSYAWVLCVIEGKKCALIRLKDRLAKEASPKVQSQFKLVMDRLNTFSDDK